MIQALAFGGAFNPPTIAHIRLAEFALRHTGLEQVVFIPSKTSYIENDQGKDYAFSDRERLFLLRTIAQSNPWMKVCDHELKQDHQPRTYETLTWLETRGYHASLLFGSDKLPELEHGWRHVEEIADHFGIVCLTRNHDNAAKMLRTDPYLKTIAHGIRLIEAPDTWQDVSSSEVRALCRQIKDLKTRLAALLPEEIKDYFVGEACKEDDSLQDSAGTHRSNI